MSSNAKKETGPAILGLILVLITSVSLLGGFAVFGVSLLTAMFNQPRVEQPAPPIPPVETAKVTPGAAPSPAPAPAAPAAPAADPALAALLKTGADTYMLCAACHGPQGKAVVPNMAPNLAGSAYINGPSERLSMIVFNGIQFPGQYLGQMIAWKAQLSDEQIAGVLSYIRSNFGNSAPPILPEQIKAAREKHGARNTPYSRSELDAVTTNL